MKDVTITAEFHTLFTWLSGLLLVCDKCCDKAWLIWLPSGAVQQHMHNEHASHSSVLMPAWPNSAS